MGAVIIAGRYVPRPPDDNIWNPPPARGIPEFLMPVGGGFPFVNKRFAFGLEEAAIWYRNGSSFAALRMPASGGFPFVNKRFAFGQDEPPVTYQNQSEFSALRMPVGGGFPFKPRRWLNDYDEPAVFYGRSFAIPELYLPVAPAVAPFVPVRWKSPDEASTHYARSEPTPIQFLPPTTPATAGVLVANRYVPRPPTDELWTGKPSPVSPVFTIVAAAQSPFLPKAWRFDYDQPREWVGQSASAFETLTQTLQNYAPAVVRPFPSGDEPGTWDRNKPQINNLLLSSQVVVNPLTPTRWKQDNDDGAVWFTKPGAIPDNYLPVQGGFPFVPTRWRFNYDDASLWTVESFPRPPVQGLVNGGLPLKPTFWGYNNDDPGTWRGFPANVSIIQQLVIASPLLPTRWTRDYDQTAFWSGAPTNVPITITQPLPPVEPPASNRGNGDGARRHGLYRQRVQRYQAFLEEEKRLAEEASEAKAKAIKAKAKLKKIKKRSVVTEVAEVRLEAALFAVEQTKFKAQDTAAALEAHRKAEIAADDEEVMALFRVLIEQHDLLGE